MAIDDIYTKALLHMDGADASTTFTDESGKTWTRSGDAQIDTAQFKFGGASGLFDGNGDYISTPDSDDFYFGTGDFTVDCWVRYINTANSQMVCSQLVDDNNSWYLFKTSLQKLALYFIVGGVAKANITMTNAYSFLADTWYHLAFVRNGANCFMFINGVSQALTTFTAFGANDVGNIAAPLEIGRYNAGTFLYHNGWIDEFRLSKGIARWTSNFTPPTQAYGVGLLQSIWID